MSTPHEDRRGHITVDSSLHGQFILMALFHAVAVGVCVGIPILAMTRSMEVLLVGRNPQIVELWGQWEFYLFLALGVYALVATGAWSVALVWRSHRMAGPVVRFTAFVHAVAAGDLTARIHVREKDEMQALANALNGMAESLEQREQTAGDISSLSCAEPHQTQVPLV